MNPLYKAPFVIAKAIQEIRKNFQPSEDTHINYFLDNKEDNSAKLAPYYRAPKTDDKLEAIKQAILKQSPMTDEAKNYFKNIPINSKDMEYNRMGEAADTNIEEPYITVNTKTNEPKDIQRTILHELLHIAPRIVPTSLVPMNKDREKEFSVYGNDKKVIKEEQFAEKALPKWIYSHIFK